MRAWATRSVAGGSFAAIPSSLCVFAPLREIFLTFEHEHEDEDEHETLLLQHLYQRLFAVKEVESDKGHRVGI
jgi:hypothetical protein